MNTKRYDLEIIYYRIPLLLQNPPTDILIAAFSGTLKQRSKVGKAAAHVLACYHRLPQ